MMVFLISERRTITFYENVFNVKILAITAVELCV